MNTTDVYARAIRAWSERDIKTALPLLRRFAEAGSADALWTLYLIYVWGQGVPTDHAEAGYWLKKLTELAENGNVEAQVILRHDHIFGQNIPQDFERAKYWWLKAAENGDGSAQHDLWLDYESGNFFEKSPEKAVYWFRKALKTRGVRRISGDTRSLCTKGTCLRKRRCGC